jgi:superfamily I DNA/RNA helicase
MNINIASNQSVSSFPNTPEQEIIIANADLPQNVVARAGSGKTTTILLATAGKDHKIFCYNKAIATEISERGGNAQTWHAWCLGELRNLGFRGQIDSFADTKNAWDLFPSGTEEEKQERKKKMRSLGKIIPILKENLISSPESIQEMLNEFRIPYVSAFEVAEAMRKPATLRDRKISFSDILVLAWENKERFKRIPFSWIDEAQDTNPIQLALAETCFENASFVGDPAQAIYSFRGAGMGSFDRILTAFQSPTRNLSFSFRCAASIIELARTIVPDIRSFRTEQGIVKRISSLPVETLTEGDAFLARTNKELIPLLIRFLSQGKPAFFKDRSFLQDVMEMRMELDFAGRDAVEKKISKEKEKAIREKLELLLNCSLLAPMEIWTAAVKTNKGPFLGTIHSSKGLEWNRVFLAEWDIDEEELSPREIQEENNLRYVGITRAKNELYLIDNV